jgi:co-chaperonin GroES (HSP10)
VEVPTIAQLVEHGRLAPKHVLIRRLKVAEVTPGGLVRPDAVRSKEQSRSGLGAVLLAGPSSPWLVGEIVAFHPHGGQGVKAADADNEHDELLILQDVEVCMALSAALVETLGTPEPVGPPEESLVVATDAD